jgi:integrase/recombinase XerD
MFLAYTGCRFSEAANLKIKDVDFDGGRATFIDTKNNENRSVYFIDPLKSKLKELSKDLQLNDLIFRNSREKRINPQDYSNDLKKRAIKADIKKRVFPHNFRHSYITHLLGAGVPITEVASLVGHKDIQTTFDTYMHLADETLKKASMRHPLVRNNINPVEIIRLAKETINNLRLSDDKRFNYLVTETEGKLYFEISIKE